MKNNEREIQERADTIRRGNIRIMGILDGEEKEQGLESVFRQIVENIPNLRKELELGIQEVNRTPNYLNLKTPSPRHIVLKLTKISDNEFSGLPGRRKRYLIKENSLDYHRLLSTNLTSQKGVESNIQNIKCERNYEPRIMYPAKLSFRYEGEIKTFPDIPKLRKFSTTRPELQEILRKY